MMTQALNIQGPQRAPEIQGEPSETHSDDRPMVEASFADPAKREAADAGGSSRPEPTRGVKKVPSLRRGAAAYAQLLQSAVKASIEAQQDEKPRPPDTMQVESSSQHSASRGNKRAFDDDMDVPYGESTTRISTRRRSHESSEMEC